ncbi:MULTISPECIES: hypothetical protein [Streptomyces]|jgi:hypothetical protein|uniref:Uncharacterized protein n=1 Tax=Streptomyces nymphaeiformis TaxID=2663842 RepID=A0A7W7U220_9ACTN|nr:hypothetical protein [Streptomyces nymphaeiformis]MBB4983559.1 hypothetical protein [Streptomyces nymphaeiformis]
MSQPVPPPGNPFADGAAPQPYPVAPQAPARDNVGLGLVAGLVAALVAAGVYGGIAGAIEREIGWAAVGVGFLVGFAAGKAGGNNPVLSVAGSVLSLGSVYLGQLVALSIIGAKALNVSATELFFEHFDVLTAAWKEDLDPLTFLFFGLAAFAAFSGAKKAAR